MVLGLVVLGIAELARDYGDLRRLREHRLKREFPGLQADHGFDSDAHSMHGRARHFECFNVIRMAQRFLKEGRTTNEISVQLKQHCDRLKTFAKSRYDTCDALVPGKIGDILKALAEDPQPALHDVCQRLGFSAPVSERRVLCRRHCVAIANATLELWNQHKPAAAGEEGGEARGPMHAGRPGQARAIFMQIGEELCSGEAANSTEAIKCHSLVRLIRQQLIYDRWQRQWNASALCDELHEKRRVYWTTDLKPKPEAD